MRKTISVTEFKAASTQIVEQGGVAIVSVHDERYSCSLFPVKVSFRSSDIRIIDTYPATIVFRSGNSTFSVHQIENIVRINQHTYEVHCGYIDDFSTLVEVIFSHTG